jgi:uncharacterized membrane protein YciS (DUF1049 family)
MRTVRRLLVVALFVLALVAGWSFAHRNPEPVRVDFLVAQVATQPLWRIVVAAFAAGAASTCLVAGYQALRLSLTARRWRRVAERLEGEVHQLRNLPLERAGPVPSHDVPDDRSG